MLKDFFLNEVENAILKGIKDNKIGQMSEYTKGSLMIEKPKNPDFGAPESGEGREGGVGEKIGIEDTYKEPRETEDAWRPGRLEIFN